MLVTSDRPNQAEDVEKIKGLRSDQFARVLGDYQYAEVVHADNLVLTG